MGVEAGGESVGSSAVDDEWIVGVVVTIGSEKVGDEGRAAVDVRVGIGVGEGTGVNPVQANENHKMNVKAARHKNKRCCPILASPALLRYSFGFL